MRIIDNALMTSDIEVKISLPSVVLLEIYCDESGFTGNNLLDRIQPYFTYSSV
jgi:hypothetical protein